MVNVQILKVNKKGEILEAKFFSFDKFDPNKFDTLSTYVKKKYKEFTPAFVYCLNIELENALHVLRALVNGQPHPVYRIGEGLYFFRCGNIVMFVEEEE